MPDMPYPSDVNYPNGTDTGFWYKLVHLNPTVFKGLVTSVLALLAAFGIVVSAEIPDAALVLVAALWPILQAVWTRRSVIANAKVLAFLPKPTERPALVCPGDAITTARSEVIVDAARRAA